MLSMPSTSTMAPAEDKASLSVILPVYNVSAYLDQCLDSLARQTMQPVEIIAVDDGSTDASGSILADYASRMPNLHITRQANLGPYAARNNGMARARGKWLIFVDADDQLEPTMFETMLNMAEHHDLDLGICNAVFDFEGRKPNRPVYPPLDDNAVVTGKTWLIYRLRMQHLFHPVWMHIYRRDFLEAHQMKFKPGQRQQDVIWTNQVLLAARRVRYTPEPLYHYRVRTKDTRSDTELHQLSLLEQITARASNVKELLRLASLQEDDDLLQDMIRWQAINYGFSVFHLVEKLPGRDEQLRQMDSLWDMGFFALMWHNARTFRHRRRLLRLGARRVLRLSR